MVGKIYRQQEAEAAVWVGRYTPCRQSSDGFISAAQSANLWSFGEVAPTSEEGRTKECMIAVNAADEVRVRHVLRWKRQRSEQIQSIFS